MTDIGIITNSLDQPSLTGPGVYLFNLVDNLLELPEAAASICLIHYRSYENPLYHRARECIVPRLPGLTEAALGRKGFLILHYNSVPMLRPFFLLSAKKLLTLHGLARLIVPQAMSRRARLESRYLWPPMARAMDKIIAVSEFTRQAAIRYWGISPDRIFVLHSGVGDHFRPQSGQIVSALRKEIGGPFLLHVSNFAQIKNADTLIRAFARLKRQGYPHRLVIIGGRWQSSPVPALISELQLDQDVLFVGYVPNIDLPTWYSGADAFVTLSLHESFCFPAAEAMACGCPVVVSNRTALPEIVGDGGLLLDDPESPDRVSVALARVLEDEGLADQLRERGLRRASAFSWRENAQKTWGIYQSLM
jgi:glycosyltransferase involved in cell wall biosynthesis